MNPIRGVSTAGSMELVALICEATAKHLRNEGLPIRSEINKGNDPDLPLQSYTDLVVVNGVEFRIDIRPHVREYPGCAQAEIALGGGLLRWEEKADRFDGFTPRNVLVATVRKKTLYSFSFHTRDHGVIEVKGVEGANQSDAQGRAWATVLLKNPGVIYMSHVFSETPAKGE